VKIFIEKLGQGLKWFRPKPSQPFSTILNCQKTPAKVIFLLFFAGLFFGGKQAFPLKVRQPVFNAV
jgi:hypothetical protein